MRYTEKLPTVEAVEFTKELATAADRQNDAKLPSALKKAFAEFDAFFADPRDDVDGTWLSIVDVNEGAEWGKYGIFCAREGAWKPLTVGVWAVRHDNDGAFDVLPADEFEARYTKTVVRAVPPAKKEGE
jgi:hypothetical protein